MLLLCLVDKATDCSEVLLCLLNVREILEFRRQDRCNLVRDGQLISLLKILAQLLHFSETLLREGLFEPFEQVRVIRIELLLWYFQRLGRLLCNVLRRLFDGHATAAGVAIIVRVSIGGWCLAVLIWRPLSSSISRHGSFTLGHGPLKWTLDLGWRSHSTGHSKRALMLALSRTFGILHYFAFTP